MKHILDFDDGELSARVDNFIALQTQQRRTAFVHRCAGTPQVLQGYSVAVHAYNSAMLYLNMCIAIGTLPEGYLYTILLTHDNLEDYTGDLLAPAKDALPPAQWNEVEHVAQQSAFDADPALTSRLAFETMFPVEDQLARSLSSFDYTLVKVIDMYEYLVRMMEEYTCGNHHPAITRGITYGTATLNRRIDTLATLADSLGEALATFWHTVYNRQLTAHDLWSLVEE